MKNDSPTTESSGFKKEIGLFGGISLVAGMTIGSGIYYLGSYVLQRSNMSMGMALLCWVIGGIISILGGLCFAELGASMPIAGGMTIYLSKAYSPAVGFINGFCLLFLNGSGSIAALSIAFVTAFNVLIPMSDIMIKLLAVCLILLLTALNFKGVKVASMFQNFTMVARIIPLFLIIILGITMGHETLNLSIIPDDNPVSISGMITMIAFATFASLWAYEGWTNLNTVAEEMKNPKRDLPLSIIISLAFITIVYTLFNFAVYKVLPAGEIADMMESGNIYLGSEVASRLMGNLGFYVVLIGMSVGIIGTINGDVLTFPRTYYAMAMEGYFPQSFKKLHPKYSIPHVATIVQAIISIILVMMRNLEQLTGLVIFTSAALNMLAIAAVLVFRKKYPDLERPYKVWGGAPTVIITLIVFSILLINELVSDPVNSLIGLIVPIIGYFSYLYFKKKNGGADYRGDNLE
ncbi:amino acid permease [Tissierella sp. MSJ-40]|uniref:Amino acid permease n=1 Tax=Tissierella simiarum TaxID=2841534 RepID=A0ABS6E924_9FIRM|nr:amino acid permease [Tissierella simiarum]MBU5439427.1 amino acid permease [Tissierella simiarum]